MSRTLSTKPRRTPKTVTPDARTPTPTDADTLTRSTTTAPAQDLDDLTPDLEEEYALLVDLATNAQPQDAPPPAHQTRQPIPKKTRVEFSQLAARARLIRCLLGYFAGGRVPKLMRDYDISWADIQIGRLCDKSFNAAWDFCERSRDELIALKAQMRTEAALDGCDLGKGEAQLIRFVMERLRAGRYGDPRYLQGPTQYQGGGGVTYQITINQAAAAPRVCGECVTIQDADTKTAEKIPILCPNP